MNETAQIVLVLAGLAIFALVVVIIVVLIAKRTKSKCNRCGRTEMQDHRLHLVGRELLCDDCQKAAVAEENEKRELVARQEQDELRRQVLELAAPYENSILSADLPTNPNQVLVELLRVEIRLREQTIQQQTLLLRHGRTERELIDSIIQRLYAIERSIGSVSNWVAFFGLVTILSLIGGCLFAACSTVLRSTP